MANKANTLLNKVSNKSKPEPEQEKPPKKMTLAEEIAAAEAMIDDEDETETQPETQAEEPVVTKPANKGKGKDKPAADKKADKPKPAPAKEPAPQEPEEAADAPEAAAGDDEFFTDVPPPAGRDYKDRDPKWSLAKKGQSFFYEGASLRSVQSKCVSKGKKYGKKFIARDFKHPKTGAAGVMVWCMEDSLA